jgi:hypothetical protein
MISSIQWLLFTGTQVPYVEVGIVQSNVCGAWRRLQHVKKAFNDELRLETERTIFDINIESAPWMAKVTRDTRSDVF